MNFMLKVKQRIENELVLLTLIVINFRNIK